MSAENPNQEGQLDIDLGTTGEAKGVTEKGNDFVPVTSAAVMARFIVEWHQHCMAMVEQMRQIPDGQQMTIENAASGEEKNLQLTGDLHIAFIAGLNTAAQLFAQMPIVTETVEETAPSDAKPH